MVEPLTSEASDLRIEPRAGLVHVAAQYFEVGGGAERDDRIGRTLAWVFAAIERGSIQAVGKVSAAIRQIGIVPDEMIDPHSCI